jgi:glycosyltransferase involved in cell wall biosynthesis
MKVLEVLHFFLPRHSAGTEVYTDSIARSLAARGHEVELFFTEKILSRPNYELFERRHDSLRCHVLVNNLMYRDFAETFDNERVEQAFAEVLERSKPDVVHFQHLMLLSLSLPRIAAAHGVPCVMTLHDFWLYCARFGQLLEHGTKVCAGPKPSRCASCIRDFKFAQSTLERRMIRAIRWTKEVAGFDLAPVVDAWRDSKLRRASKRLGRGPGPRQNDTELPPAPPADLEKQFRRRDGLLTTVLPEVSVFLAPSRTMRDRMVGFGLPARRVKVLPLGIQCFESSPREPLASRKPVFGFIGTLAPHKGVHVLIEAMRHLKGHGRLRVYGRGDYYPAYAESLVARAASYPIEFVGAVPRSRIGEAFASIDVLVMPSVWLENYPIIIQEARAARVPVVASDLGGMREAIEDGVDGLLFRAGSSRELARKLAWLYKDPSRVDRLAAAARPPLTLDAHVDRLEELLAGVAKKPDAARGTGPRR